MVLNVSWHWSMSSDWGPYTRKLLLLIALLQLYSQDQYIQCISVKAVQPMELQILGLVFKISGLHPPHHLLSASLLNIFLAIAKSIFIWKIDFFVEIDQPYNMYMADYRERQPHRHNLSHWFIGRFRKLDSQPKNEILYNSPTKQGKQSKFNIFISSL